MGFLEALSVVTMRQLRLTLRDVAVTRGRWIQVRTQPHALLPGNPARCLGGGA